MPVLRARAVAAAVGAVGYPGRLTRALRPGWNREDDGGWRIARWLIHDAHALAGDLQHQREALTKVLPVSIVLDRVEELMKIVKEFSCIEQHDKIMMLTILREVKSSSTSGNNN